MNDISYIINNDNNINEKLNEIYNKINTKFNDEITIQYIIKENQKEIKLFGNTFVENNKDNCKIIISGKEIELKEKIELNNITNNILEIKLKGISNINDMSFMFDGCSSLNSLPDISKWNTSNVNDMNNMFNGCSSLKSLPDISKWKTEQRTKEHITELRHQATSNETDYMNKEKAEEQRRKDEEEKERNYKKQLQLEIEKRKEAERRLEAERQKREQEEKKRREEEERRRREEERRRTEEGNRIGQVGDNRSRQEEHKNHIDNLARRVINGEFGNGQERRNRLGAEYKEVQNRISEILGYSKRY